MIVSNTQFSTYFPISQASPAYALPHPNLLGTAAVSPAGESGASFLLISIRLILDHTSLQSYALQIPSKVIYPLPTKTVILLVKY